MQSQEITSTYSNPRIFVHIWSNSISFLKQDTLSPTISVSDALPSVKITRTAFLPENKERNREYQNSFEVCSREWFNW